MMVPARSKLVKNSSSRKFAFKPPLTASIVIRMTKNDAALFVSRR